MSLFARGVYYVVKSGLLSCCILASMYFLSYNPQMPPFNCSFFHFYG